LDSLKNALLYSIDSQGLTAVD